MEYLLAVGFVVFISSLLVVVYQSTHHKLPKHRKTTI